MRCRTARRPGRQRGAALIALAAVLVLGTSWLAVSMLGNVQGQVIARSAKNSAQLREAKEALIAYVATQALQYTEYSPGRLPCPEDAAYTSDLNPENDGVAAATCTLPAVGRLPWRTLGIAKPLDGWGEPLWYVVSAGWALTPSSPIAISINSDTLGQITVDGTTPSTATTSNTVAALIIAAGPPLDVNPNTAQIAAGCTARTQRRGSMPPDLRDYLECENASSPVNGTFVSSVVGNASNTLFNDQVIAISPAEIFDRAEGAIAERILRDVVPELTSYAQTSWGGTATNPVYPFAAPFASPAISAFKGAAGTYQGLLPLTRGQNCTAGVDARCDPSFVAWNTGAITVAKAASGSTANTNILSFDCDASTGSTISCTVQYRRTGCSFFCSVTLRTDIASSAMNVGMGFKRPATTFGGSGGWTSVTVPSTPTSLSTDGSVPLSYRGSLTGTCFFVSTCDLSATVTIPMPTFPDHAMLNPTAPDGITPVNNWWWFLNSNWHHLTYYAVAQNHTAASATHSCSGAGCVQVFNVPSAASPVEGRAVLILAGRGLSGNARPSGSLTEYLDALSGVTGYGATTNQDLDALFYRPERTVANNDRFVIVDKNP